MPKGDGIMERIEVVEVLEKIDVYYPGKVKVENAKFRLDAFAEALKDADAETVNKNLMKHIRTDEWPPSISNLLKENKESSRAVPNFEETRAYLKSRENKHPASEEVRREEAAKVRKILGIKTDGES